MIQKAATRVRNLHSTVRRSAAQPLLTGAAVSIVFGTDRESPDSGGPLMLQDVKISEVVIFLITFALVFTFGYFVVVRPAKRRRERRQATVRT